MARVLKQLQPAGPLQPKVQGIFVSIDPERDSQAALDDYLSTFNRTVSDEDHPASGGALAIIGLRGNHAELARVVRFFGADYSRAVQLKGATLHLPAGYAMPLGMEARDEQHYQVNHSSRIYLVNPGGQYLGSFPSPHNAQIIADDLQMILKR